MEIGTMVKFVVDGETQVGRIEHEGLSNEAEWIVVLIERRTNGFYSIKQQATIDYQLRRRANALIWG